VCSQSARARLPSFADDHADVVVNPIIAYAMRQEKDALRKARMRALALERGLDPDDESAMTAASGAEGTAMKSINVLLAHGARLVSAADAVSDSGLQQERRRQLRNLDHFLARKYEVDSSRLKKAVEHEKQLGITTRKESAYDKALASAQESPRQALGKTSRSSAKGARTQLRLLKLLDERKRPDERLFDGRFGGGDDDDEGAERDGGVVRRGGARVSGVSGAFLAELAEEYEVAASRQEGGAPANEDVEEAMQA
jgi:hypothetical protein